METSITIKHVLIGLIIIIGLYIFGSIFEIKDYKYALMCSGSEYSSILTCKNGDIYYTKGIFKN
jgi:hypothetical protein